MVNIDEELSVGDCFDRCAQPFEACAISGYYTVEFLPLLRRLNQLLRVEESQLCGQRILVPAGHVLARVYQCERQPQLRTDAISVRPHMAHDADRLARLDGFNDAINDLWMDLH